LKKIDTIALALVLLYIASFCLLCSKKYHNFGYYDFDLATANQVMASNLRGDFFYSSLDGGNVLRFHAFLIYLLLLPLYALWQSPLMLLYLQTVFLAFAGWPIYLCARDALKDRSAALAFLVLYLLYPPIGYINLLHVHSVNFAPFFLACAYLWYRRSRYALFLVMLGVAMTAREEIAFIAVAFGVSAFWERRSLKWSLAPMIAGVAWFCFYFFWLAPHLRGGTQSPFAMFYSEAGGSAGMVAKNLIFRPVYMLGIMLKPDKLLYLFRMVAPLAFLPLLSPGVLFLCLPNLLLNLLATHPWVANIVYHYNAPLVPFIFIAGIAGLSRLKPRLRTDTALRRATAAAAIVGVIFCWHLGPQLHILSASWRGIIDCLPKTDFMAPAKWELVEAVPPGLPAATNFGFFTMLSNRKELDSLPWVLAGRFGDLPVPYAGRSDIASALIDLGDPTTFVRFFDPAQSPARFRDYLSRNHLGLVQLYDQIALYRRGAHDAIALWERPSPELRETEGEKTLATFTGLRLRRAELEPIGKPPMRQVRFTSLWEAMGRSREDFSLIVRVQGADGETLLRQVTNICYNLHPTSEWSEGEMIRANHFIALPADLPRGKYSLQMLVIEKFPPCRAQQVSAPLGSLTQDGWFTLGSCPL